MRWLRNLLELLLHLLLLVKLWRLLHLHGQSGSLLLLLLGHERRPMSNLLRRVLLRMKLLVLIDAVARRMVMLRRSIAVRVCMSLRMGMLLLLLVRRWWWCLWW